MTQSNQSPKLTYSLEEVLTRLEQKIDKQSEQIAKIEATLQAQLSLIQKIPDLAEKLGELKNWKPIAVVIVSAGIG